MEWRRVKTIIIVILLLVNGFLLILVGSRRGEVRRYEQSVLTRTLQVLVENGIQISEDAILSQSGGQPQSTDRNIAAEGNVVSALLGESVEGANRGGGLYIYRTDLGQVSFRSGGELSTVLEDNVRWHTDDPVSHAADLASAMKLKLELVSAEVSGGSGRVIYRQTLNGAPLFSCRLVFTYENGCLTEVSGSVLAVDKVTAESGETLSLSTVLLRFLDDVLDSGDVVSAVLAVEPGYLTTQSFTGTVRLTPVWLISTNTADYYVDGLTGQLTRVTVD